ncbi:AMP-binding protein [Bradyrhizobium erythrophlei]|uniref:3-methylmercaptopropionyl-CoA ligase n=1 Tax=Bradyrhizobium erythrophlei TaxID=1437360 RepID=A0A1H5DAX2_9BRAD|nr:AMP-binding protein [Bradyrhizobium erythrophlei]SED76053.1 fatty-acyl-CoA synthase [Bradyrhizobium erythrophlei]
MPRESYVHGHSGAPLIGKTIGALLDDVSATDGAREALVVAHQNVRWTYAELKSRSDAFASGLLALGLEPGDRVGIWSPNCAEWTIAQFATAKAGLILVNINPAYRIGELEHVLRAVGCRALITAARFKSSDYIAMIRELVPELGRGSGELHSPRLPDLRHVISIVGKPDGCLAFDRVMEQGRQAGSGRLESVAAAIQIDDAVNIQFTSGTTGLPKGATLSHHNLINNAFFVGEATGIEPGSRVCIPVPLYHCFGMVMGNLGCVTHAATMVYPSEAFDPLKTLRAVEAERCDVLYGVPTMFIAQLNQAEFSSFNLSSLRRGIMAGAPCPIEVMKEVASSMHMSEITIAYGMTETSPVSFQSSRDDPLELRVSTVGRIQPHLEAKIVDRDGRIVPRGEAGELCTRGYSVMLGYWNDEARTREAVDAAGWMHTGDLATIDDAGYCRIVGRIKDMVIRGGENIYPREVEEYLYQHPDVQDVQVFGVPDAKYGEELCAWIVSRPGAAIDEESVRTFCQGRISHYKVPRYIRFVESFPSTVTGKVQKFAMREAMIEEFARAAKVSA